MTKELYKKVMEYRITLSIAKEMLNSGIISADDYHILCTVFAEKYGLKSSTIFSDFDLI